MLKEMPTISVIIPIYNAEEYLEKSIGSVLRQSYDNLQIILVDDGSTDHSGMIIDEFGKKDMRIHTIHQSNQGVSCARNAGLSLATGKYISFVDSDDWIESDMYQRLCTLAETNLCDTVVCNFIVEYKNVQKTEIYKLPFENGRLLKQKDIKEQICKRLLDNGFFTSACDKLYLRDFLVNNRISFEKDIKIREDYFFNMAVFDSSQRVFYLSEPLYHYNVNTFNTVRRYHEEFFEISLKLYEYKKEHLNKWEVDKDEVILKMNYDFLRDIKASVDQVYHKKSRSNFSYKKSRMSMIVNDSIVRENVDCFINRKLDSSHNLVKKDKLLRIVIMLIKRKSVWSLLLLSYMMNLKNRRIMKLYC